MTQTTATAKPQRIVPPWLVAVGIIALVAFTAVLMSRVIFPQWWTQNPAGAQTTPTGAEGVAEVISLINVSSIEATGRIQPLQQADVFWGTTGQVGGVHVREGDQVFFDQILLSLDPESVPQNIIQAQVTLIDTQNRLDDLLNPTALQIAQARQAVVLAEQKLEDAQDDLTSALNPAGESLYDRIEDAELALTQARNSATLADNTSDAQQLASANVQVDQAYANLQRLQQQFDQGNRSDAIVNGIANAQAAYDSAVRRRDEIALRVQNGQLSANDQVANAEENLQDALDDLNFALQGPDSDKLLTTQAAVAVAEAELQEAKDRLDELLYGADPDDIAGLQANIVAARLTLEDAAIYAPFDGVVIALNYRAGDLVNPQLTAATIANTEVLLVKFTVDENDVAQLEVGQPAEIAIDALPGVTVLGVVTRVGNLGREVQGIVRYDIEVALTDVPPNVRLGMTADVRIITGVDQAALAVPVDAVQFDETDQEYVTVVEGEETRRVDVVTGNIDGDYVLLISGDLQAGDQVALFQAVSTSTFNPFGGPDN